MTIPARLSRMAKFHLAAGIIFSLALLAYILTSNYRSSVIDINSRIASISSNVSVMAGDTAKIKARQEEVLRALPPGLASSSQREMMLLSVEKLKTTIRGATVSLDEFSENNATLTLPVVIEFDSSSFEEGVKEIQKIRSHNLPFFEFRNIDIRRLEGSYSSARYKIEGVMTMPAGGIAPRSTAEKTS